ncbi:MAG TPA: hypothetical protein VFX48_05605, partial [Saprospiraceae bacterium]|nr:hypothetical protein [Saprospiraceae bacterium]
MKAEDFDKRIRQRMEELNPVFNERDWSRLNRKMQTEPAKRSRVGLWLLLVLLVGSGVGLAYQWSVQKDGDRSPAPQNKAVTPQAAIAIEQPKADGIRENEKQTGIIGNSGNNRAASGNQALVSGQTGINRTTGKANSPSGRMIPSPETMGSNSLSTGKTPTSDPKSGVYGGEQNHQDGDLSDAAVPLFTGSEEATVFFETAPNPAIAEGSSVAGLATLPGMAEFSTAPKRLTRAKLKPGVRPSKWLAGAVTAATAKHLNTGLAFEIKTNKNIAFSSGLLRQDYFDQRYSDQLAFSNSTEGDLGDLIRPRHSKSLDITDITIKSVDWIMPLQLKYYRPFSTRYAAFASAGLQLTLKSKTTLDFDFVNYDTQLEMSESDFDQPSNRSTLINHFTCALGVQRE